MNNFARKQLEKHGWKEGKGLGLNEDGITKPIRASMKFDTQGLGHNKFDILTSNWWSEGFNKIASQIKVIKTKTGVHVQNVKSEISSKGPSPLKNGMKGFVKAGMLDETKNEETSSNMLIESTPKSLDTSDSHLNYERVKKRKKSQRMKDSRVLEPEILFIKEIKKKKKKHAEVPIANGVFSATNANVLTQDISKSHKSYQKIRYSETEQININKKKRKKRKKNKNKRITEL